MVLETNIIYCGDCLLKLKEIPDDSIDLIYIDPPFSSNRNYVAFWEEQEARHFEDRFENVRAYVDYMTPRLKELYRVLKRSGSFYYHCDWHASHYIKVLLDRDDLFGYNNFRNDIIWHYQRWPAKQKNFQRMHEVILFYSKTYRENTFNLLLESLSEGTLKRWRGKKSKVEYDGNIRLVTQMTNDDSPGRSMDDVWDIPVINSQAKERLGYPTQKPLALLDRIIKASSNEGDIVLDAFCGCGTALASAHANKRHWVGIDISPTACRVVEHRMNKEYGLTEGKDFVIRSLPMTIEELRKYPAFEFQNWAIIALGGTPNKARVRDMGIDGKLYPIEHISKQKSEAKDLFGDIDRYIPIQVKRTDQVGRPEIDAFQTAMKRDGRDKGIFVGFRFSRDAEKEVRRIEREDGLMIEMVTVEELVEKQMNGLLK
jgi:DNA modification methylase